MLELLICWFVGAVHVAAEDDLPNIKLNRADCWCDENCPVFFPRLICGGNVSSVAILLQDGFAGLDAA